MSANITQGLIHYFGLVDWWQNEFTDAERLRLIETYGERLIKGNITSTSQTIDGFLKALASFWKPTPQDASLAVRILKKAETLNLTSRP